MSADCIQLVGTDVPGSCGSCCFSGHVQHEALRSPSEEAAPTTTPAAAAAAKPVCSDGQLLFFNCPEGTQRFSAEANLRLTRTRGFFFTRWAPSAVMGMPGLLFTVNDAGVRHANFFGPSSSSSTGVAAGLEGMLDALRRHYFSYRHMTFQHLCAGPALRQRETPLPLNYVCEVPLPHAALPSFFVLALLLSPTSALLGFRVSGRGDGTEETYGYAIVHAPPASFDPRRAKALGVPPGPMYGQLKQGTGVWTVVGDDSTAVAGGALRRYIHPHSVRQATVGSSQLYVSLVLDGDDSADVAAAMQTLFGREESASIGQQQQEDKVDSLAKEMDGQGELQRLLAQWQPSLLYCDAHAASDGAAQRERKVTLVHAVHVQPAQFFLDLSVRGGAAAQSRYVDSIFTDVRREIRQQAVRCYRRDVGASSCSSSSSSSECRATTHHFCAAVQQEFSAFPTALAHRYHLNSIAAMQFPIKHLPAAGATTAAGGEDDGADEKGPLWPYGVKHQLIPAGAAAAITDGVKDTASGPTAGAVSPSTTTSGIGEPNKNNKNKNSSKRQDVAGLLRYPTANSAVAMLSARFRSIIAGTQQHTVGSEDVSADVSASSSLYNSKTFDGQQDHNDGGSGDAWHLDGGGALTFLGTGSAVPSKYRNVSGTYLEVMYHPRQGTALRRAIVVLDFGEGSAGQLAMLWGGEALQRFVHDLAFVFISHAHADHHLGLLSLLELRHRVLLAASGTEHSKDSSSSSIRTEPLLVVCPQEVHEFLLETWGCCAAYRKWLQEEVVFDIIPAERCRGDAEKRFASDAPVLLPRLNALCARLHNDTATGTSTPAAGVAAESHASSPLLWAAEVFPVHHPANAHALLLRFPAPPGSGGTVASRVLLFSGDTRPSQLLIERCRHFTRASCNSGMQQQEEQNEGGELFLCLHEATFGEGCEEEAVRKCHSTLSEALHVAAAVAARHVVLNHFSQRYPKLPALMKSQLDGRDVDLHGRRRRRREEEEEGGGENEQQQQQQEGQTSSADAVVAAGARKMCFGFDFMRLSFASLESGETARLTPMFVQLLEEYESWGVGTTKRLRE
ncbi:ribonuclease Z [Trypanosoma grayi]|uniref:ribonuclease Z n=1 Tax=Trypanosoma grayi TaxID=71804 RepID=UPI0004F44019|nr:ribonuclease Z [Trypanosoma grayi]KEG07720.1 ribonuclease Z [Trypanosoma grayi]